MQVIIKAKVPIIKFIEHESNVNFDISFDVANGPIAADFVRDLMDTLPPMKPLVLVLKIFLQQRQFNEVPSCVLSSGLVSFNHHNTQHYMAAQGQYMPGLMSERKERKRKEKSAPS